MTWNFHDYLTNSPKFYIFKTLPILRWRKFYLSNLLLYFSDLLFWAWAAYHYGMRCFTHVDANINILLFGIINLLFSLLFVASYIVVFITWLKLRKFKKKAPELLYITCIVRIVEFPLYALIFSLFDILPTFISIIAIVEVCYGLFWLIISYRYYSKRAKAFIY